MTCGVKVGSIPSSMVKKTKQVANSTSSSSEKAKEDDETQLKKGSNHSIEESDYAYDVTAFNNTIRGKSDDVKGKVVFLTFDDGIDPTLTPQVMNILKEYGVHATFFHRACSSQSTGYLYWQELGQLTLILAMTYDYQGNGKFLF